jgi:predicted restriction endonuclease
MKKSKPLVDRDGEVRELLVEDIREFRPIAEVAASSLTAKLGIETRQTASPTDEVRFLSRKQGEARKIAAERYPFHCCVVCGLQLPASLTVAHLDHRPGNNDPDNLAYLCGTHHWMYDAGLYRIEAIKLLREHWQKTAGKPDHKPRMKDAGVKAALSRKRSAAARKAWQTRRRSTG